MCNFKIRKFQDKYGGAFILEWLSIREWQARRISVHHQSPQTSIPSLGNVTQANNYAGSFLIKWYNFKSQYLHLFAKKYSICKLSFYLPFTFEMYIFIFSLCLYIMIYVFDTSFYHWRNLEMAYFCYTSRWLEGRWAGE